MVINVFTSARPMPSVTFRNQVFFKVRIY